MTLTGSSNRQENPTVVAGAVAAADATSGVERNMTKLIKKLVRDEQGQDLAEYGIALAVVAVGAGAIAVAISGNVSTLWGNAQTAIASAV
jgi:Flp pilus assembly pilin Flp